MAEPQPSGLQFFLNAYPDGIVGADIEGTVTILNETAARMLQVDVAQAVGQPIDLVLRLQDSHGRTWLEMNRPFESINIRTGVPEQAWLLPEFDPAAPAGENATERRPKAWSDPRLPFFVD